MGKSGKRKEGAVRDRAAECTAAKEKRQRKQEEAAAAATARESLQKEKEELRKENERLRAELGEARALIQQLEVRVDHEFRLRLMAEASRDEQRARRLLR